PHPIPSPPTGPPRTQPLPADGPSPSPVGTIAATPDEAQAAAERVLNRPAPQPPPPPSEQFPTIPRYQILGVLGEGAMGTVDLARHLRLNREVALKVIKGGEWAYERVRVRFRVEAEAVAAIRHPHVVQVYDHGDAGGMLYIAMEYLRGGSLDKR